MVVVLGSSQWPQTANTHTGTERKPGVRPCGWTEGLSAGNILMSQLTKVSSYHPPFWYLWPQTGAATVTWSSPSAEPPEGFWWTTAAAPNHRASSDTAERSSCSFTLQVCGSQCGERHTSCVVAPSHTQLWALCFTALWCSQSTGLRGNFNTHTHTLRYYTGNTQTQREKQTHSQTIQMQSLSRTLQWADWLSRTPEAFSSLPLAADTVRDATQPDSVLHTHLTKGLRSCSAPSFTHLHLCKQTVATGIWNYYSNVNLFNMAAGYGSRRT